MNTTQTDLNKSSPTLRQKDPETLLKEYIAVCNRAIQENKDKFWMQQAEELGQRMLNGANFRTVIYDRNPGDVIDEATVRFDPHGPTLSALPPGRHNVKFSWKVPLSYLEDVVDRAEWYVTNPLNLDWQWMKERAKDEAEYRIDTTSLAAGVALGALTGMLLASVFSGRRKKRNLPEEYLARVMPIDEEQFEEDRYHH